MRRKWSLPCSISNLVFVNRDHGAPPVEASKALVHPEPGRSDRPAADDERDEQSRRRDAKTAIDVEYTSRLTNTKQFSPVAYVNLYKPKPHIHKSGLVKTGITRFLKLETRDC